MSMESRSTKSRRRKPPDVFPHLLTRAQGKGPISYKHPLSGLVYPIHKKGQVLRWELHSQRREKSVSLA